MANFLSMWIRFPMLRITFRTRVWYIVSKLSVYASTRQGVLLAEIAFNKYNLRNLDSFHPESVGKGWAGTSPKPLVIGHHPLYGVDNVPDWGVSPRIEFCIEAVQVVP
jgi:hypothetical protein